MSEQQRIFLAVFLCLGILLIYQFMAPTPPPVEEAKPAPTATAPAKTAEEPAVDKPVNANAEGKVVEGSGDEVVEPVVPAIEPKTRSLETPFFVIDVANQSPRITRFELKKYQERIKEDENGQVKNPEPGPVNLVPQKQSPAQAALEWKVAGKPVEFDFEESGDGVRLVSNRDNVSTQLRITPRAGAYALDYDIHVQNGGTTPIEIGGALTMQLNKGEAAGGFMSGPGQEVSAICNLGEEIERQNAGDLEEESFSSPSQAPWAAIDRQYFVVAAIAGEGWQSTCSLSLEDKLMTATYMVTPVTVAPGESWAGDFVLYGGPKRDNTLEAVSPGLKELINYDIMGIPLGFLARPMVFLLNVFHGWTLSWGIAIFMLTLLVKLVLFPVTYKSMVSMGRMRQIQPELTKIKEKFANDKERQQMEQLKLFKEKGVNPLGGCLPMLLQMPVWFALYRALWTSVDLYQQSFLWLPDLTAKEPGLPFLAVALGVVTFLQQQLTPMSAGADNQQAKIMKWMMPPMFTFIMISLPSGLVLYIFINSLLTIIQQAAINKKLAPMAKTASAGA